LVERGAVAATAVEEKLASNRSKSAVCVKGDFRPSEYPDRL
jgi:hypothetical protein